MPKESRLTRRGFLKTTALTAGALAAASAVGCSSVDTSGEAASQEVVEETQVYSACRGNCGGSMCRLRTKVREGKVVSTVPEPYDKSQEGVQAGCVRGLANPARIYGTHRLRYPMLQKGERGSGEWEQISWDEAFALIGEKFKGAIDEYGPSSLAVWNGSGLHGRWLSGYTCQLSNVAIHSVGVGFTRFLKRTGATMLSTGNDMQGIYFMWTLMAYPAASSEDLQNAKAIILWGSNPADASTTKASWHFICKARENGAKLVVIDPLYTAPAAKADMWVPIRIGTDSALMCAIVNHIVGKGLENVEYLKKSSIAPFLVKEDGRYLRQSDLGVEVAEDAVDQPVVWDEGAQGFVPHTEATDPAIHGSFEANGIAVRTIFDVALESIKPFDVAFAAEECGLEAEQIVELAELCATTKPTYFAMDWGLEHTYTSWRVYFAMPMLAAVTGNVGVAGAGYNAPGAPASSIWSAPVTTNPAALELEGALPNNLIVGEYLIEIMESGKWNGQDYPIRCLYNMGINPLDNACDPNGLVKAFEKIDFIVTAEQFMTTTAHYSDLVLPVTMTFEMTDFAGDFLLKKAVEPLGEAKTDFDILRGIAEAMGYEDLYDKTDEEYLREYLDTPENLEAGVAYDDFMEKGVIFKDYAYAESSTVEYNKFGRTEFYIEDMVPRCDFGQTFAMEDRLPKYEHAAEGYPGNPLREKYPLFGFSSHDNYHGQTHHAHNPWLDELRTIDGKPFCRIHEDAAAERGIKTGDTVRIYNDHGHVVLKALVTKGIQRESVWTPHGFFWDEYIDGYAQSLTGHYLDEPSSNANFNDWLCEVELYEGGAE